MSNLARLLVLSVVLLLLFLAAALLSQTWLHRQNIRLHEQAIATKRLQITSALELSAGNADRWSSAHLRSVGQLIDGQVYSGNAIPETIKPGQLSFTYTITDATKTEPKELAIVFDLPQMTQLSLIHGRTWILLLVVALSLVLIIIVSGVWLSRRIGGVDSRPPWSELRADTSSWMQLAKSSVAQGTALAQEREGRQKIEKDLSLNQILQTQALEEKIRLGRDLHDGVIQSLYAVGLTIEAARPLIERDPAKADLRLQECLDGLNRSIKDVRAYISGLSPEKLSRTSFAEAAQLFATELSAGRPIQFELVIDEDAAAALSNAQCTEALQVTHEAISNALRHGKADAVTVRLHRGDSEIGLLVRDNGRGFDKNTNSAKGNGMVNMQARAHNVGAKLRIDSHSGDGTRVVMTFPLISNT